MSGQLVVFTKRQPSGNNRLEVAVGREHVIEEPGYCAQFYPNANCQNEGRGSPYGTGYYSNSRYGSYARMGHRVHRHRHHQHRR